MVAKKRNTLRNKATLRARAPVESDLGEVITSKNVLESDPGVLKPDSLAHLHNARTTKREKLADRKESFLARMRESAGKDRLLHLGGVSKSAMRRRKRQIRDDLKPQMADLLISLEQEEDLNHEPRTDLDALSMSDDIKIPKNVTTTRIISGPEPITQTQMATRKNMPNIRNQKGARTLTRNETDRFKQVLSNQLFQQNTFSALRDVIKMQNK